MATQGTAVAKGGADFEGLEKASPVF